MRQLTKIYTVIRRQPAWMQLAGVVLIIGGAILWFGRGSKVQEGAPTFAARRGALNISVLEGGSLQALEAQEIKCEVRVGYQGAKILKIVEEGYLVTDEDVKNGKILCELDSSDLQSRMVQQEIQYQSALASLTDAQQNYEIQLGQNDSDIKAAEQKVRFARMDFDKFLGDKVTSQIVKDIGLDQYLAEATTNNVEQTLNASAAIPETPTRAVDTDKLMVMQVSSAGEVPETISVKLPVREAGSTATTAAPEVAPIEEPERVTRTFWVDFSRYADMNLLGDGEAKQKLRKLEDDLQVAQKELGQASTALEGTRRLFSKGFVPKTEITRDEISHESARLKVQTAETAQALFLKYEFLRSAEESLSKYSEAVRELDKARRVAISKLAQARARLNSARGQYEVQSRQRQDLQEQLAKCVLRAEKSGLVVYGANRDDGVYYGNQEPIREGATVRERQAIITIPDMTRMAVNVKIHESYIKKVKKGQKARITVDAFPDETLTGEITKVGVLPDSQNRWMNPDLKVYLTTIAIDGTHEWVKPGMSAKVEVLVNQLDDVIYVPIQAVVPEEGKQVCYVVNGGSPERRPVQVGEFTDEFIEIRQGIREGERVMLRPPTASAPTSPSEPRPADKPLENETAPPETTTGPATTAKI
ncbi:MAG TPA: efflux RND transporter periplasmic adaptor subunit [Verrucomicrobiae bacterium]|nr:efflux RND transporter periplasmic adaptor subunit [Verrucomicrobiae bacterium]